jgi:Lon protease-like protein
MSLGEFPVFPLKTLCFPGHKIPLKIFEDRYAKMLKDIERDSRFVISLISSGDETGREATPYRVGCLVEIESIQRQGDFQFIKPRGLHRVYLDAFHRDSHPYLAAECSEYRDEPEVDVARDQLPLLEAEILKMAMVLGPEESLGVQDVMEALRTDLDRENYSLFLCGCLHLPPIYLQRLLESRSLSYRMENALNLLAQGQ